MAEWSLSVLRVHSCQLHRPYAAAQCSETQSLSAVSFDYMSLLSRLVLAHLQLL